jgi:hypothetical protein
VIERVQASGKALSPWAVWTLFSLVRHHSRQQWVAETIRDRLGAELGALAVAGAFAHPAVPQSGLVPGLTEWEYYFHGRGCCLTHRVTGQSIDVDFYDETGDWFDDYFFISYLKSLRTPGFVERRLIALHPSLETVRLSILELLETKLLMPHPESGVKKLDPECLSLSDPVERLQHLCQDDQRRLIAATFLGDWLLVAEELGQDHAMAKAASARATHCLDVRFSHLKDLYRTSEAKRLALQAIADLNRPDLVGFLERALRDKPSGTTSAVLRIIGADNESRWCKPVFRLLRRVDPNGEIPQPRIWMMCADYLLRNGYQAPEVLRKLRRVQRHEVGEAALLAMEYAPDLVLILFRRALRSQIPYNRITAAAALGILDVPWSRNELIAVLRESDDQEATAECRAALMASRSPEAHRIVEEWEYRNPHEPETGPFITFREISLRDRHNILQYEMAKLHDRVLPHRGQTPPNPSRARWWPFRRSKKD